MGITEFFRHCPACGQRFHVKLEGKKLISANREEFSPTPTRGFQSRSTSTSISTTTSARRAGMNGPKKESLMNRKTQVPELTEFFRHCPACGKRFHIKLEEKKLVTSHTEKIPRMINAGTVYRQGSTRGLNPSLTPVTVREGNPIIVDVEEFQYSYKCGHCGHEWKEEHYDEHRIK